MSEEVSTARELSRQIRKQVKLPASDAALIRWRLENKGPCSLDYFALLLGTEEAYVKALVDKILIQRPQWGIKYTEAVTKGKSPVICLERQWGTYEQERALVDAMRKAYRDANPPKRKKKVTQRKVSLKEIQYKAILLELAGFGSDNMAAGKIAKAFIQDVLQVCGLPARTFYRRVAELVEDHHVLKEKTKSGKYIYSITEKGLLWLKEHRIESEE